MTDSTTDPGKGSSRLLTGIRSWGRSIKPDRKTFGKDVTAGLPGAISSVPDGMASAVLVGVNPVYGPYASFTGPIGGQPVVVCTCLAWTRTWPISWPRTVPVTLQPPDRVFGATPVLGESTWAALHEAQAWVVDAGT